MFNKNKTAIIFFPVAYKYFALHFFSFALMLMIPIKGYSQRIELNKDLIAAFGFSGNSDDVSGNGNHGQVHGALLTKDRNGTLNSAYYFDGVDDYIDVLPVSDVSKINNFTISVWVKCLGWEIQPGLNINFVDQQYIFDGHSYSPDVTYNFYKEGFTVQYLMKTDYNEYLTNSIFYTKSHYFPEYFRTGKNMLNEWHHIVYMRQGNITYHYFNGELLAVKVSSSESMNMQHHWYIGTFSANNPYYDALNYNFYGMIDDILIYSRSLNNCELDALFSGNFLQER